MSFGREGGRQAQSSCMDWSRREGAGGAGGGDGNDGNDDVGGGDRQQQQQ